MQPNFYGLKLKWKRKKETNQQRNSSNSEIGLDSSWAGDQQ